MKSIVTSCLVILMLSANAAQDSTDFKLKVAARKGINHPDGRNDFTPYKEYATRTLGSLSGYKSKSSKLSKYGGWLNHRTTATGFFHVKKVAGRWWAIDPEGYYYLHNALNAVSMGRSERNKRALDSVFGSPEKWMEKTHQLMLLNGFNGAGAWSNVEAIQQTPVQKTNPIAYTINLDFMSAYGEKRGGTFQVPGHKGYPGNVIFLFDPEFEGFCDEYAKRLVQHKDEKALFGYFSDNELPFSLKNLDGYLNLKNQNDPGCVAAKQWLEKKGITREQINDEIRAEFLEFASDRYFSIVSKAIRKYDPNHLYLGCRFYGAQRSIPGLQRAVGRYADAISINYYNHWTPNVSDMRKWEQWSGKPYIITEWYVKAEDSGLENTAGAGWIVKSQEERGLFYQNFTLGLIESKNCIGWHWFKYLDNDPTQKGAEPSNTNANKGIVDNYYQPYYPLVQKMKELNTQMYPLTEWFDKQK